MIVVDASALVAMLLEEPEAEAFREMLLAAEAVAMSPVSYWEAAVRLHSARGSQGVEELEIVIDALQIAVAPASVDTARIAADAETRFGKRTSAKLNLGDCFTYAVTQELGARLLYKGFDFRETDVTPAFAP